MKWLVLNQGFFWGALVGGAIGAYLAWRGYFIQDIFKRKRP